jgi:hypothetical protein
VNAIDLTWLSQVKDFVEVSPTNTKDDQIIANQITAFSQWVLTYCSRDTLNSTSTFTEVYDGNGSQRLFLRNSPIQSLTSVQVGPVVEPLSSGFATYGVFIEQSQKSIAFRQGYAGTYTSTFFPGGCSRGSFWKGLGNVQVVYVAGYPAQTQSNELETIASNTITLDYPTWVSNISVVYYPSLTALTLVASAPTVGEYAVSDGLYVFNSGDNGNQVLVSYTYNAPPPDLEFACRRTVGTWYKRRGWLDQSSKSLSAQGATGTTSYRSWPLAPEDRITINSYKRYAVV